VFAYKADKKITFWWYRKFSD